MTYRDLGDDRLRAAFVLSESLVVEHGECPPPERLWESAREELRPQENEEVIRHLAACAECATAWRLARDLSGARAAAVTPIARPRLARSAWAPFAAAAVILIAVGAALQLFTIHPTVAPAYRADEGAWIRPAPESVRPMPRERFVLRFTPGPEGTTYDVRVTAKGLAPLARGIRIERAEFHVPPETLAALPRGTKILWQVTGYLPDGRVSDSETFISEIE
jgi:hypothetical protein